MKLRPILILLLFGFSVAVLAWFYYAATREPATKKESLWTETLSDLDACGHRKHVKSVQYDHFAQIALRERQADIARLFHAMALSERVQEGNCADAIVRLGGSYNPPGKVLIFRGSTDNNLERSIAYEQLSLNNLRGADVDRAVARGNRYAARVLIWASAGDLRHVVLMEECRRSGACQQGYLVCPVCGNLYATAYSDSHCPHCLTPGMKFVKFE